MDSQYPMVYVNKMAKVMDKVVGKELREEILRGCKELTSKDNKEKRAEAMKCVMTNMELLLKEDDIIQIREACACKPQKFIKEVSKITSNTKDYNERLRELQETGYAGIVTDETENSFRVEFHTNTCFCGMVGKSKDKISLSWCHCCKEHIKWLYEKTLETDLNVELVSSIISGGEDCAFEISRCNGQL